MLQYGKWFCFSMVIFFAGVFHAGTFAQPSVSRATEESFPNSSPGNLPSSLDALYPPNSPAPVYLLKMHELNRSFTGMIVDLLEKDIKNAVDNYNRFKEEYGAIARLVPEWTGDYPSGPVEELGSSLRSGDQKKIMESVEKVGASCHGCHVAYMVPVQQKYHWKEFRSITVTDPFSNNSIDFAGLMRFLNLNFTGIGVNLSQGQQANALRQFTEFKSRFETLKETCIQCHDSERSYYVDESVQKMIDSMEHVLSDSKPDLNKFGKLAEGIGVESCFKCHLVHLPAAVTKMHR